MTQYKITVKDTTYDVEILDDPRNDEVLVKVNGEELTVVTEEVNKAVSAVKAAKPAPARAAAPAPKPAAAAPVAAGPGTIKSPLPGVVNSIKVRAGDKVKAMTRFVSLKP